MGSALPTLIFFDSIFLLPASLGICPEKGHQHIMKASVPTCDIVIEIECMRTIRSLPQRQGKQLFDKLVLLRDPAHKSLQVHKAKGGTDYFIGYLTVNYRVVYKREGNLIRVVAVGPHEVVDRHRLRDLS